MKGMNKMKEKLISVILAVLFSQSYVEASLIERVFTNMPDEYYLFQSSEQRSELLKSHKRNDTTGVRNRFGGKSYILDLHEENEFLRIRNTNISTLEMKIWTMNSGEPILGVNIITCSSACDSDIAFFNHKWEHVNKLFPSLQLTDFLNWTQLFNDNKSIDEILAAFDIVFFHYSFSKTSTDIEAELHLDKNKSEEEIAQLMPYLNTKLILRWNGAQFVIITPEQ